MEHCGYTEKITLLNVQLQLYCKCNITHFLLWFETATLFKTVINLRKQEFMMETLKHSTLKILAERKYSYKFSFCFPAQTLTRYEQYVFLHLEQLPCTKGNLCCKSGLWKELKVEKAAFCLVFYSVTAIAIMTQKQQLKFSSLCTRVGF